MGETIFVPPPLDVDAVIFPQPSWAQPFAPYLSSSPRPVRVISPCVGVNAPERAAREMGMAWHSCGDYDVNCSLRGPLQLLAADPSTVHAGARAGDVLRLDINTLDLTADGLVSGPPCPPFSTIGSRMLELDPRSCVFLSVAAWIIHLITHGRLSWWILENVPGIRKRRRGEDSSFGDWFMREMRQSLPAGWSVSLVEHNSALCCLPQSRDRIFFVGTSPNLRRTPLQRRVLLQPPLTRPRVDIIHFLDKVERPGDFESLTLRQQVNVLEQLKNYRASASEGSTVGIVDVARDPLRNMDSKARDGGTRCLRTNCSHLWILPSPSCEAWFGPRGRFLSREEKCRVAGIVPSSLRALSDAAVDTAVGNTIPVPLVGHIMYAVLRAWILSLEA